MERREALPWPALASMRHITFLVPSLEQARESSG